MKLYGSGMRSGWGMSGDIVEARQEPGPRRRSRRTFPACPPARLSSAALSRESSRDRSLSRASSPAAPAHTRARGPSPLPPPTAGSTPAVVLTTRRHADRIAVTVRDRGTGIAPEDLTHIFDPFFTTRRAGTGLGLPIAKNIIDGLGGSLSVDSQPEAGTEIRIEIPLAAAEPA